MNKKIEGVAVPEGWEMKKLNKAGECIRGVSYKPTNITQIPDKNNICILRANNIKGNNINFYDLVYLKDIRINDNQILNKGDITICMSNGSKNLVGKNAIFKGNNYITSIGAFCGLFRVDNNYDTQFIKSLFESSSYKYQIDIMLAGSAINNLKNSDIMELDFLFPKSLPEQQKIAQILSTVDETIDKTEQLIIKYEQIKMGLMEDLFTKGIDLATGKFHRKFRDSELGAVPEEWEVEKLGDVGVFKNGINKGKEDFGFGNKFVNISDAYSEKLSLNKLGLVNINNVEIITYCLKKGDIIFVRSSVKPSGVGYNTLFDSDIKDIVYSGFMIRYRLNDKKNYLPIFYNYYFRYYNFRQKLINYSTVSANTNINQDSLQLLKLPKLSIKEQQKIAQILTEADNKISKEKDYKEKLEQIKKGLMGDLLMGRVRV